ncbi:MAG: hypothetical protein Q8Q62_05430 [Mesorhizobium sp.]|nr:hypothetical protein [Mesorhizobium sp.]
MIRLVLILACVILGAVALYKLFQAARARQWDWTGIAFAIAFVLLAVYLRNVTGIGGGFD